MGATIIPVTVIPGGNSEIACKCLPY